MLTLRYRFNSDSASDCALAQSLAPWLASHVRLKLETVSSVLPIPELYSLFSQPLLQTDIALHTSPPVQAHPGAVNIWWWQGETLPHAKTLDQVDEMWSATPAGVSLLQQHYPNTPVRYQPPCLAPDIWITPASLPPELQWSPSQKLLLWSGSDWRTLNTVLATFIPLAQDLPELSLVLQLNHGGENFEHELMKTLSSLCQMHHIENPDSLHIQTLIGPLSLPDLSALLQHCHILLAPENPLMALAARSLNKAVMTVPGLLPEETGCTLWQIDPDQNQIQLKQLLTQTASPLSEAIKANFSVPVIGEALLKHLGHLTAQIDLPARREANRKTKHKVTTHNHRKQKYSLFHTDYQSEELQARRAWHQRYATYFETACAEIMDIGCGSGIFLEILKEKGVPAFGIDPDTDMVTICQNLGLQALLGDERILAEYPENSLGGIHASHVIEHMDGQRAIELVENAFAALMPGGLFIVRTPNWRNEMVRHEGFWLDITHVRPYPLPLLQQVFKDVGFEVIAAGFEDFGWNDTYIVGRKPREQEHAR